MTATHTYGKRQAVPREKLFPIRITLPLTADMLKRADAALVKGEDRVSLIRTAIERELKRRERNTR